MSKTKKILLIVAILCLVVLTCGMGNSLRCEHNSIETRVVVEASCSEIGFAEAICLECEKVIDKTEIQSKAHSFGEEIRLSEPGPGMNGEGSHTCVECGHEEIFAIICMHENVSSKISQEPTCIERGAATVKCKDCGSEWEESVDKLPHDEVTINLIDPTCAKNGWERIYCKDCNSVIREQSVESIECSYGEWHISKYATPFNEGERYRVCDVCANKEVETYSVVMENNSIYIPSAGMQCKFAVTGFTQSAVDCNDVIYTTKAYAANDPSNPFILGHWYGSMIDLHKTKIGQFIYVCKDGAIETYEVLVSEYATERNRHYITGKTTGVDIWDFFGSQSNSKQTCYYRTHGGTNHMPEENDGKTLHLYTCHYGKDKPGWNSKDGNLGRWIVMANLIDTRSAPVA